MNEFLSIILFLILVIGNLISVIKQNISLKNKVVLLSLMLLLNYM